MDASTLAQRLGIAVTDEWLRACLASLRSTAPGFDSLPAERQLQAVLAAFLTADLNEAGAGCLPGDLQARPDSAAAGRAQPELLAGKGRPIMLFVSLL